MKEGESADGACRAAARLRVMRSTSRDQHLAPLALIPAMLIAERSDRFESRWSLPAPLVELWPGGLALVVCGLLAFQYGGYSNGIMIGESLAVAGLLGLYVLRRGPRPAFPSALCASCALVVAAPALWHVSNYGGDPMTVVHVFLGTIVFDCLVLILLVGPWAFAAAAGVQPPRWVTRVVPRIA